MGWNPIETAPKDRSPVLIKLKKPLPVTRRDLEHWHGIIFVGRHPGLAEDGFDIGWQFAAPVGHGGFPDDWIEGWAPLPASEESRSRDGLGPRSETLPLSPTTQGEELREALKRIDALEEPPWSQFKPGGVSEFSWGETAGIGLGLRRAKRIARAALSTPPVREEGSVASASPSRGTQVCEPPEGGVSSKEGR